MEHQRSSEIDWKEVKAEMLMLKALAMDLWENVRMYENEFLRGMEFQECTSALDDSIKKLQDLLGLETQ